MNLPLFDPLIPPDLAGARLLVASLLLDNRGHWLKSRHIAQRRMGEPFELFPGVPCFAMAVVLNVLAETAALGSQLFHSGCL